MGSSKPESDPWHSPRNLFRIRVPSRRDSPTRIQCQHQTQAGWVGGSKPSSAGSLRLRACVRGPELCIPPLSLSRIRKVPASLYPRAGRYAHRRLPAFVSPLLLSVVLVRTFLSPKSAAAAPCRFRRHFCSSRRGDPVHSRCRRDLRNRDRSIDASHPSSLSFFLSFVLSFVHSLKKRG